MSEKITPPFANIPRARLERLVCEGFERIEREAAERANDAAGRWDWTLFCCPMNTTEFMVLCAADYYLRSTKGEAKDE